MNHRRRYNAGKIFSDSNNIFYLVFKDENVSFRYGDVREISAQDYVAEVNKAGDGVFVVLHLYKQGIPLCALINQYLTQLAAKFPTVKVS